MEAAIKSAPLKIAISFRIISRDRDFCETSNIYILSEALETSQPSFTNQKVEKLNYHIKMSALVQQPSVHRQPAFQQAPLSQQENLSPQQIPELLPLQVI